MRAEALQPHRVGAVRLCRIGDALDVVENHGAGAFQIDAVAFQAGIVDDVLDAVMPFQELDGVPAPFGLAARREHRIDGDGPPAWVESQLVGNTESGKRSVSSSKR